MFSCFLWQEERGCLFDGAWGLKTFTSKRPPQKPLAATSSLAPSSVIAEAPESASPESASPVSASPVIGCKVGSMHTLWYTSYISFAVRSLTSLCCTMGNPPIGLERACSTEKLVPQAHVEGISAGCQSYLRAMASLKAPLWRVRPNSSSDSIVSQLEAPLS